MSRAAPRAKPRTPPTPHPRRPRRNNRQAIDRAAAAMQHRGMADLPGIANNPDIRFLGKLLGDVIRNYGGEALYARTESIRTASVDRHRTKNGDSGPESDLGLDALNLDETLDFVRGFMLFSMLANLAEDRQGVTAEQGADVAAALERLAGEGIDKAQVMDLLGHTLIA